MWRPLCLLGCFFVTLASGTVYTFSAYAPQLCTRLDLNVKLGSAIGMAANFAMALSGPFAGMLVDYRGFKYPVIISSLATFIGYGIVNYCYLNKEASVVALSLAMVLVGMGSTFAFSAAVKCAAINFSSMRGTATAITMSGFGLSAFAMSILAKAITSNSDAVIFLKILLVVPIILFMVGGPLIIKFQPKSSTKHNKDHKEIKGFGLIKEKSFWFYFFILGLLSSIGQSYIYSCGYIVKALSVASSDAGSIPATAQTTQVAILSVANCIGRLLGGVISDAIVQRLHKSRAYALLISAVICFCSSLIISRTTELGAMALPTALTGIFYGILYGSFPGVVSDEFGVQSLSSNWGIISLSPIVFSSYLTIRLGHIYDHYATDGVCVGNKCFRSGHEFHCYLAVAAFFLVAGAISVEKRNRPSKKQ